MTTTSKIKKSVKKTAAKAVKATKKVASAGTATSKAKKIISKVQKAQHDAADIAERIGTTMETIGGAILSVVNPGKASKPGKTAGRKPARAAK